MSPGGDWRQDDHSQARRVRWLRRGVVALLVAGVVAFLVQGADGPADPFLVPAGEEAQTRADESPRPAAPARPPSGVAPVPTTTLLPRPMSPPGQPGPTPPVASPVPPSTAAPAPTPPASPPATAPGVTTAPAPPLRRPLAGFAEVVFRISRPDGATFDAFALLAADEASRQQGLMGQSDLRGYDAMVFRFDRPSEGSFFMRNTRIPLSIAFFDDAGRFVSATDMMPCPDEATRCPSHFAEGPYLHAIEVAAGDLPRLGIGAGAVLSFL